MAPVATISRQSAEFYGRGVNLAVISIVFTAVAISLVCSRLVTRWAVRQAMGGCDYTITISVVVSVGLTVSNCIATAHGSGKVATTLTPGDLRIALKAFWAAQILYLLTTMLTKTSIVFMYMRIFPNPKFHRIAWIVVAYVNMCGLAGIGATIHQCTPRERIWDREVYGTCIDLTAFLYTYAAANMLGDFVIIALPIPAVRALNLPQRQKMGLLLVFALGGFVCITSILRMTTLKTGAQATDVTYGTLDSTIWSTIEANTAIICACLPMLKAPLARLFPRLFPRGSSGSDITCPSVSTACRNPGPSSSSLNAASHSYDNWGRLESKRQMDMIRVSTGVATPELCKQPTHASLSSDDVLCGKGQGIHTGTTAKRRPVDGDLDGDSGRGSKPPQRPRPAHTRGSSEDHLITNDRSPNNGI